ncbi:MAG: NAD(P)/FAD-dependent oxidoreductase [Chloroflexi bacterium]|nr:NAD(P)/FAD-dependent oxidoreductase [Chloroflexota bacterium]
MGNGNSKPYPYYDVAVIGAGPVGSQVAFRLAGEGHRVVVLEQKASLNKAVCCTGIISQECASTFAIDDAIILRRVNSARVFSPSGKSIRLCRPETQVCIVDRTALNTAMASRAQNKGADYIFNSRVHGISVGKDSVTLEIEPGRCQADRFEARMLVIANGFSPEPVEGVDKPRDFVMGIQVEVATTAIDEVEVYMGREVAPGFFAWLVPTSPGKALLGLMSRRQSGLYLKNLMASLASQGKIISTDVKPGYRAIPLKPSSRTFSDRVIVVGSAAGQVKPTTGGGIYYGLICANIAADNLSPSLGADNLSARHLVSYDRIWRKKLGKELNLGYWARKVYEQLSDTQIDWLFDIVKSEGIAEALLKSDDFSFDWHTGMVTRLIGHRALFEAMKVMKPPFLSGSKV